MIKLSNTQQKVLDIYRNDGHVKAWNYWKLMGHTYGIFLGEVPSNDFIDGEQLANHIGLAKGVLCNVDTPWLKFILDGNIIYVAKKPLMHTVSWDEINKCGAVFENEGASITVGDGTYDITLLRGLDHGEVNIRYYGFNVKETYNSEWNRLMYPIHSGINTHNDGIPIVCSVDYCQWAKYSDLDLITHYDGGRGSATWSIESVDDMRIFRGIRGVNVLGERNTNNSYHNIGWRPALRLL